MNYNIHSQTIYFASAVELKEYATATSIQKITLEDLYKSDVPKELLGRINSIVNLYPLSVNDYYEILTKSESSPLQKVS